MGGLRRPVPLTQRATRPIQPQSNKRRLGPDLDRRDEIASRVIFERILVCELLCATALELRAPFIVALAQRAQSRPSCSATSRTSAAIASETSRDHPSSAFSAITRRGRSYWPLLPQLGPSQRERASKFNASVRRTRIKRLTVKSLRQFMASGWIGGTLRMIGMVTSVLGLAGRKVDDPWRGAVGDAHPLDYVEVAR